MEIRTDPIFEIPAARGFQKWDWFLPQSVVLYVMSEGFDQLCNREEDSAV